MFKINSLIKSQTRKTFPIGKYFLLLLLVVSFSQPACIVIDNPFTKLPPGKWRGVLKIDKVSSSTPIIDKKDRDPGMKFEPISDGEIPFQFEVVYDNRDDFHILLLNGSDTFKVTDITYATDRRIAKDTFTILFPFYNAKLVGFFEENVIEGEWILMDKENYKVPFAAFHGKDYRFTELKKEPIADLSGLWQVEMGTDTDTPKSMMGEFVQNGNHITGSFIHETGDYRFLEGTVQADKLYLSQFDGATAYLVEARIRPDGHLEGIFRSGSHHKTTWSAVRTDSSTLKDPAEIVKETGEKMTFQFPDSAGKMRSLTDKEFEGKAKIIQLMGTWCHNCYDETQFLMQMQEQYQEDLAIIGLAFERSKDEKTALQRIRSFEERVKPGYPILLAALTTDKQEAAKYVPALSSVESYPTTIYLDRENNIVKIHSGFYGPSSSLYKSWVEEFEKTLNLIINK